jgi:16S rRNA (uracil1498-N3)-methyltransferase
MTERVFWCQSIAVGEQVLDAAESRHARTSLRLEAGHRVTLLDGLGHVGHAIVLPDAGDRKREAHLRVDIERVESVPPPGCRLTLIVAACKGERMDWLVEKCTELGVDRLWITTFERTVANPGDGRLERFERLARQACKQCFRPWIPDLRGSLSMPAAVEAWCDLGGDRLLVAHPDPDAIGLAAALATTNAGWRETAVIVGPEGGLSDAESSTLRGRGAQFVRLARHVLRVETAALAVASVWADRMS